MSEARSGLPLLTALDAWLWRRGIGHMQIRPLLRNLMLLSALLLATGGAVVLCGWGASLLWLGTGCALMTWIFWELARFFLRRPLSENGMAMFPLLLLRWGLRFGVAAGIVYLVLAVGRASPLVFVAGVVLAEIVALASYLRAVRR
ncbi:hypothetical protein [uncultured Desulfovibrio sp.]|uniref:ATP synthase subunit I n=1 Tax=Candidatus Desulfovibrio intestinavium TaxID=2838534 RepID=A0A9D2HLU2_9BACT|nr:hypothetical protein [uncultured Desulfovibrio sp.]HJA78557.1 hypothetical protein [Candidatus Desulfovibrio intestinavium]